MMTQKYCNVKLTLESPLVSEPSDDALKCIVQVVKLTSISKLKLKSVSNPERELPLCLT